MAIAEWDHWPQPHGPDHFTVAPLPQLTHCSSHSPATLPRLSIPHRTTADSKPQVTLTLGSPLPLVLHQGGVAEDGRPWRCRGGASAVVGQLGQGGWLQ